MVKCSWQSPETAPEFDRLLVSWVNPHCGAAWVDFGRKIYDVWYPEDDADYIDISPAAMGWMHAPEPLGSAENADEVTSVQAAEPVALAPGQQG